MLSLLLLLLFLTLCGSAPHGRCKRALWNFGGMIRCATGRSEWDFNNYGCHCGFGGGGPVVDPIDQCCKVHDACYKKTNRYCGALPWSFNKYLSEYSWNCTRLPVPLPISSLVPPNASATPISTPLGVPVCTEGSTWFNNILPDCAAELCKCDSDAAKCFSDQTYPTEKPSCGRGPPVF